MISYVAHVLNIFASAIQNTIHVTSFVGKVIIVSVTWIWSIILNVIDSVALFLQIVYEDNIAIFTEEIPTSTNSLIHSIFDQFKYLWKAVSAVCYSTHYKLSTIITLLTSSVDAIVIVICEVLLLLRKTIFFFGDSVWLMVTFIPVHLPQILKAVLRYSIDSTVDTIVDGYMTLLTLTNFLSEVPLESFMGLMSTIIIVRLGIHFRENIQTQIILLYWTLIRNVLYFYYVTYNYVTNSEVRVITQMANGEEIRTREVDLRSDDLDDAYQSDALCVICQERQKCVLTLPCRHVCLCTECCRRLYGYQRTCPICRTFIYHSVTVYL